MNALGRLVRLPLRAIPCNTVLPVLCGPLRGARWVVGAGTHGCWLGTYERAMQNDLVRLVQPGCVVYDLGANAGFFTLLAARLVGPSGLVVAVEPNPRNVADLRKHLALNGVGHVRLVEAAVGATDGAARFAALGHPSMGRLTADGPLMVRVVALDALGLPAPSVIKCDVEGAEVAMLRGARRLLTDARPVILLETHGTAATDACRAILAEHGYAMTERAHSRYLAAPH